MLFEFPCALEALAAARKEFGEAWLVLLSVPAFPTSKKNGQKGTRQGCVCKKAACSIEMHSLQLHWKE